MKGVLIAAAGALWESAALQFLDTTAELRLDRRCVDVADLVSTAQAGEAAAALLSLDLPGLDADTIYRLEQANVHPVVVDGEPRRAAALGVVTCLPASGFDQLLVSLPQALPEPVVETDDTVGDGKIVAVWGPAGAPGRSTVALGLADAWSRQGTATLVVDADPYGGAIAQMLGILDEVSGLLAASRAANAGRVEKLVSHLYGVGDNLAVLTGIPRPDLWSQVRPGAVAQIVRQLRSEAPISVVDVGFCLEVGAGFDSDVARRNQLTLQCLAEADHIIAVGRADPVGLTRLVRGLHDLDAAVPAAEVSAVVNMTRASLGWSETEIGDTVERLTGRRPHAYFPYDRVAVDHSAMAGRLLSEVQRESRLAKSFMRFVDDWARRYPGDPMV